MTVNALSHGKMRTVGGKGNLVKRIASTRMAEQSINSEERVGHWKGKDGFPRWNEPHKLNQLFHVVFKIAQILSS
jgi:hypothetical protein